MIEIVFIIVALGILSLITIPYFVANRDDAYFIRVLKNSYQLISDIATYKLSQNDFPDSPQLVTNVSGVKFNGRIDIDNVDFPASISLKDKGCYLEFVFKKLPNNLVVMKMEPNLTVSSCPILNQDNEFDKLKNSEYPISSKRIIY